MFVDHEVVKKIDGEERYDKFAIASSLFDVSFKGATCSLIDSQILKDCGSCNLKFICNKIDEVIEDYTVKTTIVTDSFNFES